MITKHLLFTMIIVLLVGATESSGQSRLGVLQRVNKAFNEQPEVSLKHPIIFDKLVVPVKKGSGYYQYTSLKFNLVDYNAILNDKPKVLYMEFPLGDQNSVKLKLYRAKIFSDEFSLGINDKPYDATALDMGVHYQGVIESHEKKSLVSLSFFHGKLEGIINSPEVSNLNISSLRPPAGEDIITFGPEDIIDKPEMKGCGEPSSNMTYSEHQIEEPLQTRSNLSHCVSLWLEANYNVYQYNGNSLPNTIAFCNSLFNANALIYNNEQITMNLGHLEVWTATSPYPNPSDPNVDDRTEVLTSFQNYRASTFTGDLAELLTQLNIGGVAAGFSGLCNSNRSQSMCISGLYENTVGTYPNYSFNVYLTCHEKGHLYGSRHTHACVWNGNNTAIDGCAGYVEGSCTLPGYPSGGGTIMSYCWNPHWIDFTLGFGPQPGAVIRNSVNNGVCLTACNECVAPSVTIGATPNPICVGKTLSLSSSGGVSYSWSGPAGWTSNVQNPSISNIQSSAGGIYTVTVTASDGCTNTATVSVTVNPLPIATAAATPNPICMGKTLSLSSNGGTSYSWTGPNGFSSSTQNPTILNVQTSNAGIYTVTVTSAAGCTATATVSVTVNPLPIATATATPNPVCAGATLILSSSGGSTYSWSGPNGFSSSLQNPSRTNIQQIDGGIYTVTVTSAAGCTSTATVNVTVSSLSQLGASVTPNPVCQGELATFSATGGIAFKWSGPNNFFSDNREFGLHMEPNMAGVYTVTVTNSAGCTGTATVSIAVNPAPNATISVSPNPACSGQTVQFTATGGATYKWSGPFGFSSTISNPTINNVQQYHSGTYTVQVTNAAGCKKILSIDLKVGQSPAGTIRYENTSTCVGSNLQLFASGGSSYSWSGPGGWTSSLQNPIRTNNTLAYSGTYSVTITNSFGCSVVLSVVVTIRPLPVVNAWTSTPEVCEGGTAYLFSSGATSYAWDGPQGYHSTFQNPIIITIPSYMTGNYVLTGTNEYGCNANATVNIQVQTVNAQINASPNPVPKGGTLYLTASGGQYYQWTGPDGFHTNQQNPIIYNFSGIKQGVYTCIVSSSAGCEDTKMVLVNIRTSLIGGENELRWTQGIYSQVYPNPASASLILDTDYKGDMNYRIINVNGEIILKGLTSSGRSISIDRIIPGNYFIQWTYTNEGKEHSFISRFIKTN